MPCSRSARRPSVSSDRSGASLPRALLVTETASIWSSKIAFESYSRRPMSVDLPSSTEPAVAILRSSLILEITFLLAVFHPGFADAVVGAGGTPLCHAGGRHLGDDLLGGLGIGLDAAGAGRVADRAVAHLLGEDRLAVAGLDEA